MKVFRIAPLDTQPTALDAFSGHGAAKYGGRWNSKGFRAVYCSDSLALACLETLVHIRPLPRTFPPSVYYVAEIPDALIERPVKLAGVTLAETQALGTQFLRNRVGVALEVPTTILSVGSNLILNPIHPDFKIDWISGPLEFVYDSRLT